MVRRLVQLHPAQHRFWSSQALYRGFVGGRGSGKSFCGAFDMLTRCRPGRLYMIASPTYTILSDTTFRTFKRMATELGGSEVKLVESSKTQPPAVRLGNGAEVLFRSADDPEKLRGPNLSGVWLDEASLMHRDAYEIAIACLREGGEQGWLSATFTPAGLTHWTYEIFGGDTPHPNTEIVHAHTRDNPFNPVGFADTLAGQYSPMRARQELAGEFCNLEGAEWPAEYFPPSIWFNDWPACIRSALALDPAQGKGEKAKGCYASFVEARLDALGVVWLECWASKDWDARQLAETMVRLVRERRPNGCSTELNGAQGFLVDTIKDAAARINVHLPLYGITNSVDKEVRVRDLGPLLAQGRLRVRDTPGGRLLVQQLRDFPVGEWIDCGDAAEMACRLLSHLMGKAATSGNPSLVR